MEYIFFRQLKIPIKNYNITTRY